MSGQQREALRVLERESPEFANALRLYKLVWSELAFQQRQHGESGVVREALAAVLQTAQRAVLSQLEEQGYT